jgi:hypothetical protein
MNISVKSAAYRHEGTRYYSEDGSTNFLFAEYYVDHIEEQKLGEACCKHVGEEQRIEGFGEETRKIKIIWKTWAQFER